MTLSLKAAFEDVVSRVHFSPLLILRPIIFLLLLPVLPIWQAQVVPLHPKLIYAHIYRLIYENLLHQTEIILLEASEYHMRGLRAEMKARRAILV